MTIKSEHSFNPKNAGAWQATNGVENLFSEAAEIAACRNNCIPLVDEENQELNKKKYSLEYEMVAEEFGGHGFNIRYWT